MVEFFTAILALSLIGLISLLYVKHWELSTGRLVFGSMRPKAGDFFRQCVHLFERTIPSLVAGGVERGALWLRTTARGSLAHALILAERALERALHALRHKTVPPPHAGGQASEFLREVAEHKKQLLKRERTERTIVDSFLDKLK